MFRRARRGWSVVVVALIVSGFLGGAGFLQAGACHRFEEVDECDELIGLRDHFGGRAGVFLGERGGVL
jgi:hypothetical protein